MMDMTQRSTKPQELNRLGKDISDKLKKIKC